MVPGTNVLQTSGSRTLLHSSALSRPNGGAKILRKHVPNAAISSPATPAQHGHTHQAGLSSVSPHAVDLGAPPTSVKVPPGLEHRSMRSQGKPVSIEVDAEANVRRASLEPASEGSVPPLLRKGQEYLEVDAAGQIIHMGRASKPPVASARHDPISSPTIRRAHAKRLEAVSGAQWPFTGLLAQAATKMLLVSTGKQQPEPAALAPASNPAAPAPNEGSSWILSIVFILLVVLATLGVVFAVLYFMEIKFETGRVSRVRVRSGHTVVRAPFVSNSTGDESDFCDDESEPTRTFSKQDMTHEAIHKGLLWRLTSEGVKNLPWTNFECGNEEVLCDVKELRNVEDMNSWRLRYFNLKKTADGLSMSYLSEKDDMEPITMLLQPFQCSRYKFAMEMGSVQTVIDVGRSNSLASMRQYQVGLEEGAEGQKDYKAELPDKLYLFYVTGVWHHPEAKACPGCGFRITSHPTHCCAACLKDSCVHDVVCAQKSMPEKDDTPIYKVYAVDSKQACQSWVSRIQAAAFRPRTDLSQGFEDDSEQDIEPLRMSASKTR